MIKKMNKLCSKCNICKPIEHFHKRSTSRDGFRPDCKDCRKLESTNHYFNNSEKLKKYQKIYAQKNKEKIKINKSKYFKANREQCYVKAAKWRTLNREKDRLLKLKSSKNLKENRKLSRKKYAAKMKLDVNYRVKLALRSRLHSILKTKAINKIVKNSFDLIGCTSNYLKLYLEQQFKPGMTWENYGVNGWHIDHIIPLSKFNLTTLEEQKKACHYTNLQPLWAFENLSKGAKIL